jgi:adenylate cyclase
MTTQEVKRKLAAILSADVKGYSRLMGEDEEWTVHTLTAYKEVMGGLIQQHRGRVVGTAGDSVLAEFASVVDAVQCGVEIQQVLRAKNAMLPENRKMEFRIGINLGDVIEEGDTIYGDGVNIAARLEGLAEAGGICISESAYQQIENKLPLRYDYLGEHEVKNIAKPVRVYRAQIESEAVARRFSEVASKEKMVFPLPDKPSIAVLPFVNMSDDPKQEFFSDGMTEEIITALSKNPYLFVIARQSTFAYKGKPVKVKQVSEELGVRYVLEGSVRRSGEKIRITAQLIDAMTGYHLWAERYDRDLKEIFALQDEITMKILQSIRVKLMDGEQALRGKPPRNLEAYLKLLQAQEYLYRFSNEGNIMGKQLAEEAIALDPEFAGAYYAQAGAHMMDVWFGSSKSPKESLDKAVELAQKAISLDPNDPRHYGLLGNVYVMKRNYDKAIAEGEKAVALDPGGADVHAWLGMSLNYADKPKEAIPLFEKAIRLNPNGPTWYFHNFGHSYRMTGQYQEAITQYKKALRVAPNNIWAHLSLAATYSLLGRDEEARAEAEEVLRMNPKFSLEYFAKALPFKNQAQIDCYIEALRKAGLK